MQTRHNLQFSIGELLLVVTGIGVTLGIAVPVFRQVAAMPIDRASAEALVAACVLFGCIIIAGFIWRIVCDAA